MKTLYPAELSEAAQRHPHGHLVQRVAASQCFSTSMRMKELLLYVADCALRSHPEEATEQQIGIHVFGRAPGFNSGEDSIVRTQARALRQKLAEYFSHEGIDEDVIIEIPKGHYLPVFRPRFPLDEPIPVPVPVELPVPASSVDPPSETLRASARLLSRLRLPVFIALIAGSLLCGVLLYAFHKTPLERFWAPFLANNNSLVIYSNAVFTGDSTNGLKYALPGNTAVDPDQLVETYTGIGELTSVYNLTRLFEQHHASFTLKRSQLVTWDQAQMSNLIFIGSVAENSSLRVLPPNLDFTMTAAPGSAGFVNHHPKAGELALYARPEHPLTKDYATLSLLPGLQGGRRVLIFSGLTTLGTQAAVEFALSSENMQQLLPSVVGPKGEVRPFEALIETRLGGGVPLQSRLVSLHIH